MFLKINVLSIVGLVFGLSGCVSLTPETIAALGKDDASICATTDIRGGVGSLMSPAGGYGQGTLTICRSNKDNARLEVKPDGTMIIQNGGTVP